jgi:hypothetical protein
MNRKSQSRWIVTLVTVSLAALAAVAPAGAWEDPTDGRQAGNGQGSLPQFDSSPILSNSVHEGVLAERRSGVPTPVSEPIDSRALDVHLRNAVASAQSTVPGLDIHLANAVDAAREPTTVPVGVTSNDDGFSWSPGTVGVTASVAAGLLMVVAMLGMTQGRRRRTTALL